MLRICKFPHKMATEEKETQSSYIKHSPKPMPVTNPTFLRVSDPSNGTSHLTQHPAIALDPTVARWLSEGAPRVNFRSHTNPATRRFIPAALFSFFAYHSVVNSLASITLIPHPMFVSQLKTSPVRREHKNSYIHASMLRSSTVAEFTISHPHLLALHLQPAPHWLQIPPTQCPLLPSTSALASPQNSAVAPPPGPLVPPLLDYVKVRSSRCRSP